MKALKKIITILKKAGLTAFVVFSAVCALGLAAVSYQACAEEVSLLAPTTSLRPVARPADFEQIVQAAVIEKVLQEVLKDD